MSSFMWRKQKKAGIQIIKRFSGGGTVVVDHNTVLCDAHHASRGRAWARVLPQACP